jgi:hypothetical protein
LPDEGAIHPNIPDEGAIHQGAFVITNATNKVKVAKRAHESRAGARREVTTRAGGTRPTAFYHMKFNYSSI